MCPMYIYQDFVIEGESLGQQVISEQRHWALPSVWETNLVARALCIRVNKIMSILHVWDTIVKDRLAITERMYMNMLSLLDAHLPLALEMEQMAKEGRVNELTFLYAIKNNLAPEQQHEQTLLITRQAALPFLGDMILAAWLPNPPVLLTETTAYTVNRQRMALSSGLIVFLMSKCGVRKCQMKNIHERYTTVAKTNPDFRCLLRAILSCVMGGTYMPIDDSMARPNIHSFDARLRIASMTDDDTVSILAARDKDFALCIMRVYLCMHLSVFSPVYSAMKLLYDVDDLVQNTFQAAAGMFSEDTETHELVYSACASSVAKRGAIYTPPFTSFWAYLCSTIRIPVTPEEVAAKKKWEADRIERNAETGGRTRRAVKEMESSSGVPVFFQHMPSNFSVADLETTGISKEAAVVLQMMHYWRHLPAVVETYGIAVSYLKNTIGDVRELYRIRLLAEEMNNRTTMFSFNIDKSILYEDVSKYTHLTERSAAVAHEFPSAFVGVCLNCTVVSIVPSGHEKKHAASVRESTKMSKCADDSKREKKTIQTTGRISMYVDPFTQACKMICMGCDMRTVVFVDLKGCVLYAKVHHKDIQPSFISACMDCGILTVLRSDCTVGLFPVCKQCAQLRREARDTEQHCYYDGHYLCPSEVRCSFVAMSEKKLTHYVSCWMHDPKITAGDDMSPLIEVETLRMFRRFGDMGQTYR